MADWLNINPSTGTGNASVSVSATEHTGQSEKNCTLKVSSTDGKRNVNVSVTQYYKPYATIEKSEFDGDAAMTEAYIYSDYDFWFKEIPQWVRITDTQGNTISANQPVSAPLGGYKTVKVYLYQNVSNRRSFAFTMGINLLSGGTADIPAFTITQEAGSATAFSISKTLLNSALSNPANSIEPGEAYTTYVSAEEGYTIKDVKVYVEVMNMWSQITGAYNPSTQQITLSNVQWNVLINVACSAVASSGGDSTLVLTKGGEWRIEAPSYITPSATSGTGPAEITLDFGTNTGGTRTGEIKIIYTDFTDRVEVSQNGRQPIVYAIDLTTETTEIPAGGGIAVINVVSNGDWTLSAPDYVLLSITGGTGNETVTATISQNSGYAPRNITVSGTCHSATDSVTFEQDTLGITYVMHYTTTDGNIIVPSRALTNANLVGNTYVDGVGTFYFDAPITSIADYAFYKNDKLESITLPETLVSTGTHSFTSASSLNEIVCLGTTPPSRKSGSDSAFFGLNLYGGTFKYPSGCDYSSLVNPNYYTPGYYQWQCETFGGTGYGEIQYTAPDFITPQNPGKQFCAANLINQTYDETTGIRTMIFDDEVKWLYDRAFQGSHISSITIPDTCKRIGDDCFLRSSLSSIDLGSVEEIGGAAFQETSLTNVTIPGTLRAITAACFRYTHSLTGVTIEEGVEIISYEAFWQTNLTELTLPSTIKKIDEEAFLSVPLNKIVSNAVKAPWITYNSFQLVRTNGKLYIPEGSDYSSWLSNDQYYLGYYNWNIGEPEPPQPEPQISITADQSEIPSTGGTITLTIECNNDWIITAPGFISPNSVTGNGDDVKIFVCTKNNEYTDREIVITGTCKDITKTITLKQLAKEYIFDASLNSVKVSQDGGTLELTITTNDAWSLKLPDYITASATSGVNSAIVTLNVSNNEDTKDRYVQIVVIGLNRTIYKYALQYGNISYYAVSYAQENIIPSSGSSIDIYIFSSGAWSLECNDTFAHLSSTSGVGPSTITLTIDPNTTGEYRRITINTLVTEAEATRNVLKVVQSIDNEVYNKIVYYAESECSIGSSWNVNLVTSTFDNGIGVMTFDGTLQNLSGNRTGSLSEVYLPSTITGIGPDMFNGAGLDFINLPSKLIYTSSSTFNGNRLTYIVIPPKFTPVNQYEFNSNPITCIVIGNNNKKLGIGAFRDDDKIRTIYSLNTTAPTFSTGITATSTFTELPKGKLYHPINSNYSSWYTKVPFSTYEWEHFEIDFSGIRWNTQ